MSILLIVAGRDYGQTGLVNYGTENAFRYNPAFLPSEGDYGLSVLPVANFEASVNLPLSLNTVFSKSDEGGYEIDLERFAGKLAKTNQAMFSMSAAWFSFSANIGDNRWAFGLEENIAGAFTFDRGLIRFINSGNKAYRGEWFETDIPVFANHFSTLRVTTTRDLNPTVRLGFSAKLYFGKAVVDAQSTLRFFTEERSEYIDLESSGKMLASLPVERHLHPDGYVSGWQTAPGFSLPLYWLNLQNPGLGVDVGFTYKYNDKWLFSAALVDLGFISWFSNINSMNLNGAKRWEGFDISPIVDYRTNEEVFDDIINLSFADSFLFEGLGPVNNPFVTSAPLKFIAGAEYSLAPGIDLLANSCLMLNGSMLHETFVVTGRYRASEKWQLSAGLAFSNHSFFNLPVGFSYSGNRISARLSIQNLWGLFLSDYSRQFGGSFSMAYRFQLKSREEKVQMERYPFSNPYRFENRGVNQP